MSRTLTPGSSLDTLRKEAKRWFKALRAGNDEARQRLRAVLSHAPADPGLRDVQHALAREHGLAGWTALRQALDDLALERQSRTERREIVLKSVWQGDLPAARRILARWPDLGHGNLALAAATGNLPEVRRLLAADPAAGTRKSGPLNWEPLLYLAYARLPGGDTHQLEIAEALLDRGADANAQFDDGWGNPFKVLTGVIGQGEGDRPEHPQAHALAELLISRGADPWDSQALYDTSITREETDWLEFLWQHSERRDRLGKWTESPAAGIGGKVLLNALGYLLGNAVAYDHIRRAEWLLRHGANPDGVHAYSGRPLREEALIYGHAEMAALIERFGAATPPLQGHVAFQAACFRLDRKTAGALARSHPEFLEDAAPMLTAARKGRTDVVALLLGLGMNVDVADETGQRGLQNAVMGNAIDVVRLLVRHGSDIDRPTQRFGGAMGFAAHFGRREIAALLAPLSRDLPDLVYLGKLERVGALLAADPALANAPHPHFGTRPLFALPDDEDTALVMARLLLSYGADPQARNGDGLTAEQAARNRGLLDAADLMRGEEK